jgi:hypothetical protein
MLTESAKLVAVCIVCCFAHVFSQFLGTRCFWSKSPKKFTLAGREPSTRCRWRSFCGSACAYTGILQEWDSMYGPEPEKFALTKEGLLDSSNFAISSTYRFYLQRTKTTACRYALSDQPVFC